MRDLQELLAHPALLVSHIKTMRADGDFQGAAALLREAQHQDPSDSEIRGLLAQTQLDLRFCDEERAWIALVSETRGLVEEHVERGEFSEAQTVLTGVERRHGAIEELEELKERLQGLRHERELAELASHLGQAQRLKDEGYLQESVWEARQALALLPEMRTRPGRSRMRPVDGVWNSGTPARGGGGVSITTVDKGSSTGSAAGACWPSTAAG